MPGLKQIAVAAAVAILFAVFVALLVDLIYPEPRYDAFCAADVYGKYPRPYIEPPGRCDYDYQNNSAYNQCLMDGATPVFDYNQTGCPVYESCNFCNKEFDEAQKSYSRNIFIIVGIIGIIAIFAGTLWRIEFLGTGLMFGGIFLLFYGTVRYFGDADKTLRVLIVFAELLIVIWIGYKKLYKKEERKKQKKR